MWNASVHEFWRDDVIAKPFVKRDGMALGVELQAEIADRAGIFLELFHHLRAKMMPTVFRQYANAFDFADALFVLADSGSGNRLFEFISDKMSGAVVMFIHFHMKCDALLIDENFPADFKSLFFFEFGFNDFHFLQLSFIS